MYAKYAKCGGEYTREVAQRIGPLGYYQPPMCGLARSKGIGGMTSSSNGILSLAILSHSSNQLRAAPPVLFPVERCHIQATSLEQLHLYSFLWNIVTFKQLPLSNSTHTQHSALQQYLYFPRFTCLLIRHHINMNLVYQNQCCVCARFDTFIYVHSM